MCDQRKRPVDPDEEPTQPAPPQTTADLAREWEAEFSIPSCERPTRKIKKLTFTPP